VDDQNVDYPGAGRRSMSGSLTPLFEPRGIALVGASEDSNKRSGKPLRYLMHWFDGPLYPVNPNRETIEGLTAYDSVTEITGPVDLAVVTLPAAIVPQVIAEMGEVGISHAIVISAGFAEADDAGKELEAELEATAKQAGVRVVGPNSFGVINCENGLVASIMQPDIDSPLPEGPASLVSQSGGFVTTLLDWAQTRSIGLRHLVSSGNETDLTTPEYISHMIGQTDVDVVATYIEGIEDGREFMAAARDAVDIETPVVALKGGRSPAGSQSAHSHTSSMTGDYDIFEGACRQTGVITVDSAYELLDCVQLFEGRSHFPATRIGGISDSGGGAVSMGDHVRGTGLDFTEFTEATQQRLVDIGGIRVHAQNPFDLAAAIDIEQYDDLVRIVGSDPNVDVLLWYSAWNGEDAIECARGLADGAEDIDIPLVVIWPVPRSRTNGALEYLEKADVPVFPTVKRSIDVLERMRWYHEFLAEDNEELSPTVAPARGDVEPGTCDCGHDLPDDETITEPEGKQFLDAHGLMIPAEAVVDSATEAVEYAREFGGSVVMKVISTDIPHRSRLGLVEVAVPVEEVADTHRKLLDRADSEAPEADVEGVLVQSFAGRNPGVELLVGGLNDRMFGPTVLLAPGGVTAERAASTVHKPAPVSVSDAQGMIDSLETVSLSTDQRRHLVDVLVAVGDMLVGHPEITELDCNPVVLTDEHGVVVDTLVQTGELATDIE